MTTILDPTDERVPIERSITPRSEEITGTLALLDISKPRGNVLLDQLAIRLAERLPNVSIERFSKPTFTKPSPDDLRNEVAERCTAVIQALAD